jgi:hypothetical protein
MDGKGDSSHLIVLSLFFFFFSLPPLSSGNPENWAAIQRLVADRLRSHGIDTPLPDAEILPAVADVFDARILLLTPTTTGFFEPAAAAAPHRTLVICCLDDGKNYWPCLAAERVWTCYAELWARDSPCPTVAALCSKPEPIMVSQAKKPKKKEKESQHFNLPHVCARGNRFFFIFLFVFIQVKRLTKKQRHERNRRAFQGLPKAPTSRPPRVRAPKKNIVRTRNLITFLP